MKGSRLLLDQDTMSYRVHVAGDRFRWAEIAVSLLSDCYEQG